MIILRNSRGFVKQLLKKINIINYRKKEFMIFQQHVNFSLINNKTYEKNVDNLNNNKNLIELYHELVKTNKIESDPYQYNLVLVLQALENNLNNYYRNVEENLEKKDIRKKFFFSSFFSKGRDKHEEDTELDKEIKEEDFQNDDNFFIYVDNRKIDKDNTLRYMNIKDERYFTSSNKVDEKEIKYIRGLYVHGSVGRGKTYFLNLLFDRIKLCKLRIHYHNFMQEVHKNFHEEKINNSEDPIKNISIKMSKKYKLIFIDEFQVVHISDAMVIKSLFNHLFYRGTVLLCSSNRNPIHLYHNGLNRDRFLPFIKLLFKFNYIFEVDNYFDFRVKNKNTDSNIYNIPTKNFEEIKKICNDIYCKTYNKDLNYIKKVEKFNEKIIVSNYKKCNVPYKLNNYAIYSFEELCNKNISIDEYNAISNESNTLFIYDIEKMNEENNGNEMRRFILLIDILYEKNTKVFFFSNIPIFQIFQTSSIISYFQILIEKMKIKYDSFDDFKNSSKEQLKCDSFNKEIFIHIMSQFDINREIGEKLFDAINYNINKEYIPIEYLRQILCFHIMNYEIDVKKHLKYLENEDVKLEPIPYLLFDEKSIDTSQENTFASMRTLSRIKHMSTSSYLEKHKKIYEHNL
ncbi:nucleotide binding protein, putative [Plasmodium gallinaceum]|uniref:Nucleotide binding protein, putative n=1 Tax=Plasmodium gallinaceum TaxID=5849 RepID=A0A1J1GKY9_PLAGA|nr:nucleotide binding protein, putative [Plasmodium gallinaceum]CRG92987.1 nucleotide binding protein, putative [Plasmodium gallinaceum]